MAAIEWKGTNLQQEVESLREYFRDHAAYMGDYSSINTVLGMMIERELHRQVQALHNQSSAKPAENLPPNLSKIEQLEKEVEKYKSYFKACVNWMSYYQDKYMALRDRDDMLRQYP